MGTFSRMLLPSIRMSFMVLPPELDRPFIRKEESFITRRPPRQSRLRCASLSGDGHLESSDKKIQAALPSKGKTFVRRYSGTVWRKGKSISRRSGLPGSGRASDRTFWREKSRQRAEKAGVGVRTVHEKEWEQRDSFKLVLRRILQRPLWALPIRRILLSCASVPAEHYKVGSAPPETEPGYAAAVKLF